MRRRFKLPQRRCRGSLKKKNSPGQRRISVLGAPTGGNHSTCGFVHKPLQPALRGRLSPAMFQQTAPDAEYVCPQGSALVLGKKSGGLGLRHTGFVGYWAARLPRRAALRRASVLLKLSANYCFLVGIRLVPAGVSCTFQNCGPYKPPSLWYSGLCPTEKADARPSTILEPYVKPAGPAANLTASARVIFAAAISRGSAYAFALPPDIVTEVYVLKCKLAAPPAAKMGIVFLRASLNTLRPAGSWPPQVMPSRLCSSRPR